MGGQQSRLKRKHVEFLSETTHFTVPEVEMIYRHFVKISNAIEEDDLIQEEEFREALGLANKDLSSRIFKAFDTNSDGNIEFEEFLKTLSILSPKGTTDQKLRFSFRLYDQDNDGHIDRQELIDMVKASVIDNHLLHLDEEDIEELVDNTFAEVDTDRDGHISYEEYELMVKNKPGIVDYLTINVIPEPGEDTDATNSGGSSGDEARSPPGSPRLKDLSKSPQKYLFNFKASKEALRRSDGDEKKKSRVRMRLKRSFGNSDSPPKSPESPSRSAPSPN